MSLQKRRPRYSILIDQSASDRRSNRPVEPGLDKGILMNATQNVERLMTDELVVEFLQRSVEVRLVKNTRWMEPVVMTPQLAVDLGGSEEDPEDGEIIRFAIGRGAYAPLGGWEFEAQVTREGSMAILDIAPAGYF